MAWLCLLCHWLTTSLQTGCFDYAPLLCCACALYEGHAVVAAWHSAPGCFALCRIMLHTMGNTATGAPAGTFAYAAPEMLLGEKWNEKVSTPAFLLLVWR